MNERISVVGLGKLGLCFAACLAEKGFETLGVDIEQKVVDTVNRGATPWFEPGLDELIARHGGKRLRATMLHEEAIEKTDITFVIVATPSNEDGAFSNRFVEAALTSLAMAFGRSRKTNHLFVISSTVMPGTTESKFIPLLERHSGRKFHKDFEVCFDPDFVALGNVMSGFLRPDLVVIGESSREAGDRLEKLHCSVCENKPVISRMSLTSAEIAKVSLNAFITLKISFANSLANICERIPGADVDAITGAIGSDRRISPHYFRGGVGFGGTCFPRDTRAFISMAEKNGIQPSLIQAVEQVNKLQDQRLADTVVAQLAPEGGRIGVLGLAFTPNTSVITESPAVKLIRTLLKRDIEILAYDPFAIDNAKAMFGSTVEYVDSAESCIERSDVVVLTLRDPNLVQSVKSHKSSHPYTLVDCWRQIDSSSLPSTVKHIPLGRFTAPDQGQKPKG
jgi:UDPglucose 6-dehydrogenase